eukprot:1165992-Amorphochlora_amoeboformis.AAC.1
MDGILRHDGAIWMGCRVVMNGWMVNSDVKNGCMDRILCRYGRLMDDMMDNVENDMMDSCIW